MYFFCNLKTSVISPCDVLQANFDYRQLHHMTTSTCNVFAWNVFPATCTCTLM